VVCPRFGLQLALRGANACLLSIDNAPTAWIECSPKAWSLTQDPADMGEREMPATVGIAMGAGFVCALDASGVASWWGDALKTPTSNRPVFVRNARRLQKICATTKELCGLDEDGKVSCAPTSDLTAREVMLGATAVRIACGDRHACAVTSDGAVECWGDNERGQLGDATTTFAPVNAPRTVKLPARSPAKER
jgi:hypothetical protein